MGSEISQLVSKRSVVQGLGATLAFGTALATDDAEAQERRRRSRPRRRRGRAPQGSARWANAGRLNGICVLDADTGDVCSEENADTSCYLSSLTKIFTAACLFECESQGRLNLDAPVNDFTAYALSHPSEQTSADANGDFIARSVPSNVRRQMEIMGTLSSNLSARTVAGVAAGIVNGAPRPLIDRANALAQEIILPALAEENVLRAEEGQGAARLSYATNVINTDGVPVHTVVGGRPLGETQVSTPFELAHFIKGSVERYGVERFKQIFGLPYVERGSDRRGAGCILLKNNPRQQTDGRYNGTNSSLSAYSRFLIDNEIIQFGKTGYIRASGNNLAVFAEYNGRRVIAVKFGGQGGLDAVESIAEAVCEALGIDQAFIDAHQTGDLARLEHLQAQRRAEFAREEEQHINPYTLY